MTSSSMFTIMGRSEDASRPRDFVPELHLQLSLRASTSSRKEDNLDSIQLRVAAISVDIIDNIQY